MNLNLPVGTIFKMSWGYDQTNVNYFQVTRLSKSGVFVREIGQTTVDGTEGFMSCKVSPVKDKFLETSQFCGGFGKKNPETFRRVEFSGTSMSFNFKGRYFAYVVTENSQTYCSWYH